MLRGGKLFSFSLFGSVMIVVVKSNCFHITMFYEYCQKKFNVFVFLHGYVY